MQRIGRVREGESVEHQTRLLFAGIGPNGKFFIEIQQLMENLNGKHSSHWVREKKTASIINKCRANASFANDKREWKGVNYGSDILAAVSRSPRPRQLSLHDGRMPDSV